MISDIQHACGDYNLGGTLASLVGDYSAAISKIMAVWVFCSSRAFFFQERPAPPHRLRE